MDRRRFIGASGAVAAMQPAQDRFAPVKRLLKGSDPLVWLFTGDSITHGAVHTMGARSYTEHFAERVRWELQRRRDVVINTGISGDRMPRILADLEWRVHRHRPHVVSLMMGMNDCLAGPGGRAAYRDGLEKFAQEVAAKNAVLVLQTPNLIHYPADESRKDLSEYVRVLREFAAAKSIPLIDHYQHWSETRKTKYDLIYWLHDGSIHPNHYGHLALARLIFQSFGVFDAASLTGRLFLP